MINQREVGSDTHSFVDALKQVLHQDPDVILIGEPRDSENISVALTAAETGHLVSATLHTQDTSQTIDRVIDVFPQPQQGQVRAQLAATLNGVVCQTLVKRASGSGRAVATAVMMATPAIVSFSKFAAVGTVSGGCPCLEDDDVSRGIDGVRLELWRWAPPNVPPTGASKSELSPSSGVCRCLTQSITFLLGGLEVGLLSRKHSTIEKDDSHEHSY